MSKTNVGKKSNKNTQIMDYSKINRNRNMFMNNLPFPKKTLHQILEAKKRYTKSKTHFYNLLHNLPFPIKENQELVNIRNELKIIIIKICHLDKIYFTCFQMIKKQLN